MAYLLDANIFIQAKNLHYGLDFCPAFWDWLIAGNAAKQVCPNQTAYAGRCAGEGHLKARAHRLRHRDGYALLRARAAFAHRYSAAVSISVGDKNPERALTKSRRDQNWFTEAGTFLCGDGCRTKTLDVGLYVEGKVFES